jgi:hypothetical protein
MCFTPNPWFLPSRSEVSASNEGAALFNPEQLP